MIGIIRSIVNSIETKSSEENGETLYILMDHKTLALVKEIVPNLYTIDGTIRKFAGVSIINTEVVKGFKVVS